MPSNFRTIYATTDEGAVQLAASADRWYLTEDYVHLSPHHTEGRLLKYDAQLKPIVDNPNRGALVITDMGAWGAEIVDELRPYMSDDDVHIEKVRMSGFYGTHLDQVLRTQGINTLFLTGVNTDQCVTTTMEDAYFRDYNAVLLTDGTATSSPDYCKDAVIFNANNCWGFSMSTHAFAAPEGFS